MPMTHYIQPFASCIGNCVVVRSKIQGLSKAVAFPSGEGGAGRDG